MEKEKKQIVILVADIVTAFSAKTVGTKVVDQTKFLAVAEVAIASHDFAGERVPGQGYVECPEAVTFLSSGVGKRSTNPEDFHSVLYRGRVECFLKREKAGEISGCALIVYTREAYLNDPEVKGDATEFGRVSQSDASHVLVAVLGFCGPKAPLTPFRLVSNLAGGNNEAATWTADEIRAKAKESLDYWDTWCLVAD